MHTDENGFCIQADMRSFKREETDSPCAILYNNEQLKGRIMNFSRMGALIITHTLLSRKKYLSLLYRNEKNEMVQMLTYVVHSSQKNGDYYIVGLQFVGIEGKISLKVSA